MLSLSFTRYANVDFIAPTSPGNFCRRQASTSFENGLACYRGLGMTQDCAKIWADTSWNVSKSFSLLLLISLHYRNIQLTFLLTCFPFEDRKKLFRFLCPQIHLTANWWGQRVRKRPRHQFHRNYKQVVRFTSNFEE